MMRCPRCNAEISESRWIRNIAVCSGCGEMCAIETDEHGAVTVVKGTGTHADTLTPDELKTLRVHRRPFLHRG